MGHARGVGAKVAFIRGKPLGKRSREGRNQRQALPAGICRSASMVQGCGGSVRETTVAPGNERPKSGTSLVSHSTMQLAATAVTSGIIPAKIISSPRPCSPQKRSLLPVSGPPSQRGWRKGTPNVELLRFPPALIFLPAALDLPGHEPGQRTVQASFVEIRPQFHRFVITRDRLGKTQLVLQEIAQVAVRRSIGGFESQCVLVAGDGFGQPSWCTDAGQVGMSAAARWGAAGSPPADNRRASLPSQFAAARARDCCSFRAPRIQLNCLPETLRRFRGHSPRPENAAQIVMRRGIAGIQPEDLLIVRAGSSWRDPGRSAHRQDSRGRWRRRDEERGLP